jgi:hypothetical protein
MIRRLARSDQRLGAMPTMTAGQDHGDPVPGDPIAWRIVPRTGRLGTGSDVASLDVIVAPNTPSPFTQSCFVDRRPNFDPFSSEVAAAPASEAAAHLDTLADNGKDAARRREPMSEG